MKKIVVIFLLVGGLFILSKPVLAQADYDAQVKQMRELAKQGNVNAEATVGINLFTNARGNKADIDEAIIWLKKAADQGNIAAQFYLGSALNTGTGVPQDAKQAFALWSNAAQQNFIPAQITLGSVYFAGTTETPKDGYKCYMWFGVAANKGDSSAIQNRQMLERYMTNDQIREARALVKSWDPKGPMPPQPAFQFPTADALKNPPVAKPDGEFQELTYLETVALEEIPGTPTENSKAIDFWTKLAEEKYNVKAMFNLGLAYHRGLGVTKDDDKANFWMTLAIGIGRGIGEYPGYKEARNNLRLRMTAQQIEKAQTDAKEWIDLHPRQ